MNPDWQIQIEQPKALTVTQERELLREANRHNPASATIRQRFAALLLTTDDFDEVVALLDPAIAASDDLATLNILLQALLSRERAVDDHRVIELAGRAAMLASSPIERAELLAYQGKAFARFGDRKAAIRTLRAALDSNPQDRNAYKRLATLHLQAGDPVAVLALADGLLAKEVCHSRLLASRSLALALLGDKVGAKGNSGLDQFLHRSLLPAPVGWETLDAFNAALAQELVNHPALRYDRYGSASSKTWRVDEPSTGKAPLARLVQQSIARQVEAYVKALPDTGHPWTKSRPATGILHNWCVITEGQGHEEWHVHQHGWLSGVYYVAVPDSIASGTTDAGCIAFGLPEDVIGDAAARSYGLQFERPRSGLMMLFPSHSYHRTFPHGDTERRICIAFDIWPG